MWPNIQQPRRWVTESALSGSYRRRIWPNWSVRDGQRWAVRSNSLTGKYCGQCSTKGARNRAKKKGLRFTLTRYRRAIERRLAAGKCELTGLSFEFSKRWGPRSPSIHKVRPERGYTYPNIKLVCFGLNAALGSWGMKEFAKFALEALRSPGPRPQLWTWSGRLVNRGRRKRK